VRLWLAPPCALLAALSREAGVATEMLLTRAEQVWDDGRAPPDYAWSDGALSSAVARASLHLMRTSPLGSVRASKKVIEQASEISTATSRSLGVDQVGKAGQAFGVLKCDLSILTKHFRDLQHGCCA
jgi:hypothetical protein